MIRAKGQDPSVIFSGMKTESSTPDSHQYLADCLTCWSSGNPLAIGRGLGRRYNVDKCRVWNDNHRAYHQWLIPSIRIGQSRAEFHRVQELGQEWGRIV